MAISNEQRYKMIRLLDREANKLKNISEYFNEPYFPNLINIDEEYKRNNKRALKNYKIFQHLIDLYRTNFPELSIEDIVEFISNPGFAFSIVSEVEKMEQEKLVLSDAFVLRDVESQIVLAEQERTMVEKLRKKPVILTVSYISKISLSNNIFYVNEYAIDVPKVIYDTVLDFVDAKLDSSVSVERRDLEVWKELIRRSFVPRAVIKGVNYNDADKMLDDLDEATGFAIEDDDFIVEKTIMIDNRSSFGKSIMDLESQSGLKK